MAATVQTILAIGIEAAVRIGWIGCAVTAIALPLALYSLGAFTKDDKFQVRGKTIVVTGGSDGMGKSAAKLLAHKGANVVIVGRDIEKMEGVMKTLRALPFPESRPSNQRHAYIPSDVTKPGEAKRILAEVKKWNNGSPPDTVWTIAGSCYPVLFLDATPEKLRQQMDLNYWSHADMAQAILSEWLSPEGVKVNKERHLIFTASSAAFWSIAGYGPYAPPKAALRALADTLYHEVELYSQKVKIHVVLPGSIDSPGFAVENKYKPAVTKELEKDDPLQTPDEVARKSIEGIQRGEFLITTNWLALAMRGCAWSGSPRNNWFNDTVVTWIASLAWIFVQPDLVGKVRAYGKKNGHPSTYAKEL